MPTPSAADNGHRTIGSVEAVEASDPYGHDAPDPAPARGTVHGDLSQMAGRPMNGVLYLGVLAVAAGIDIATFYQVLALVMRNVPNEVVWLGVVGFTVTALSLAHTVGVRLRERIDGGDRALSSPSAWLCFVVWLFVGITAFIVRWLAAAPIGTGGTTIVEEGEQVAAPTTGADNPLLAALLFLSLYLATGMVAAIAGYLRHNTAAKRYAISMRSRTSAAKHAARSAADLTLARQTKLALDEERRRRAEGWEKAQEEWAAIARRLKQEARLRLAASAQNPSTTDAYFMPPPASVTQTAPLAVPVPATLTVWPPVSVPAELNPPPPPAVPPPALSLPTSSVTSSVAPAAIEPPAAPEPPAATEPPQTEVAR